MSNISIKVYEKLREAWALGRTFEEFGGDKSRDYSRLEELTEDILDLLIKELKK